MAVMSHGQSGVTAVYLVAKETRRGRGNVWDKPMEENLVRDRHPRAELAFQRNVLVCKIYISISNSGIVISSEESPPRDLFLVSARLLLA